MKLYEKVTKQGCMRFGPTCGKSSCWIVSFSAFKQCHKISCGWEIKRDEIKKRKKNGRAIAVEHGKLRKSKRENWEMK